MTELLTFGEPMVVWIPHEIGDFSSVKNFSKGVAGAELNVAIGVRRLGHSVTYYTKLGSDFAGDYILKKIKDEDIDWKHISITEDFLTGTYFKTKVDVGDPSVYYMRKNSAASHIRIEELDTFSLNDFKILHLTGITAALSEETFNASLFLIEKIHNNNIPLQIIFDPNIRKSLWDDEDKMRYKINLLASKADYFLPGIAEGKLLCGKESAEEIAEYYLANGVRKAVIVKCGGNGAYYKTATGIGEHVPGFKVDNIVDTVGAGDAFATGIITGLLEQMRIYDAVVRGNALGAKMLTVFGDNEGLPSKKELECFIQNTPQIAIQ